jgi:hypothetical protein
MEPDKAYPATQDIQMLNVTAKAMTKLVLKLDSSKASDSDGLKSRLLKDLADEISPISTIARNHSILVK